MHWLPLIIVAYVTLLVQTTVGKILTVGADWTIGPDFMAMLAVFVTLNVRDVLSAMLSGWILGMMLELAAAGGVLSCIGPMSLGFALAAGLVFYIREVFFRDRAITLVIMAAVFCAVAHSVWLGLQGVRGGMAGEWMGWSVFGLRLVQILAVAVYTGLLMPLAHAALIKIDRWFIDIPASLSRRRRR